VTAEVEVVDYDPAWPTIFDRNAALIRNVLGPAAIAVDHVGSTSVPGLPAKPVIDINLIVADTRDEAAYAPALERAGFEFRFREPDWFEHRFLRREQPRVNLHVFSAGCDEHHRMLAFRDWLRANAADRRLYAETKLALATRRWESVQDYADAKTQVVAEIMQRALAAAERP
jgi:GrpB-like predicted nucleotidyltransferase (UPF0157 family)